MSNKDNSNKAQQTKQNKENKIREIKTKLIDLDTVDSAFFLSALTNFETGKVTKDQLIEHYQHVVDVLQNHELEVKSLKEALEKTKNMFVDASKLPQIEMKAAGDPRPPGGKYGFIKTETD
jgi:hypothetical protein